METRTEIIDEVLVILEKKSSRLKKYAGSKNILNELIVDVAKLRDKKYYERKRNGKKVRELKLGICSRCKKERPIYQIAKQLCTSCRVLDSLERHPKRYQKLLKQNRENYWKNPTKKRAYNHKYYRTGDNGDRMREYGRNYWREKHNAKQTNKN